MYIHDLILNKIGELVFTNTGSPKIIEECNKIIEDILVKYAKNDFTMPELENLFDAKNRLVKTYFDAGGGVVPKKPQGQLNQHFLYSYFEVIEIFTLWSLQIPIQSICHHVQKTSWIDLSGTQVVRILNPLRVTEPKINPRDVVSCIDVIAFFEKKHREYIIQTTWVSTRTFAKETNVTEGTVNDWVRRKLIQSEMSRHFYYIPPFELERVKSYKTTKEVAKLLEIKLKTFINELHAMKQLGIIIEDFSGNVVISLQEVDKLKSLIKEGKMFSRVEDNKKRAELASVIESQLGYYLDRFEQLKLINFEELTFDEQHDVIMSAKSHNDKIFNYFVAYFHARIKKYAAIAIWRFGKDAHSYDDCYQFGLLGLLEAIRLYTDQKDFIGYACKHIKWQIHKRIQEETHFKNLIDSFEKYPENFMAY